MSTDEEMARAVRAMAHHAAEARAVDRTDWTDEQWVADAGRLMDDLDGSVSSLVNGHVLALLAEVKRLRRWKAEAMPVLDGLQELGKALDLPLGERITGREALRAVVNLRADVLATGRLADRIAAQRDALRQQVTAGRCGDWSPGVVAGQPRAYCTLTAGHLGWHRGENGSEWSAAPRTDDGQALTPWQVLRRVAQTMPHYPEAAEWLRVQADGWQASGVTTTPVDADGTEPRTGFGHAFDEVFAPSHSDEETDRG